MIDILILIYERDNIARRNYDMIVPPFTNII